MISYQYKSPIGHLLFQFKNQAFTQIRFVEPSADSLSQALPLPSIYERELNAYFKGEPTALDWPIQFNGTEFQMKVWQTIKEIPYGKTITYKQIGEKIGSRGYRAIGTAVGNNPLAIIIPCHRVLGAKSLGGYRYGLLIKNLLLELENALPNWVNNIPFSTV